MLRGYATSDVGREGRWGLLYIMMLSLVLYMLAVRCCHLFYLTHIMNIVVVIEHSRLPDFYFYYLEVIYEALEVHCPSTQDENVWACQ